MLARWLHLSFISRILIHMLWHLRTYFLIISYWCYGTLIILLTLSANCEVWVSTFSFISEFLFSLSKPALTTIFASIQKALWHFDILGDQVVYAFLWRALFFLLHNTCHGELWFCNSFPATGTFYSHDLFTAEGMISQRLHVGLELLVSDRLQ